MGTSAIMAEKQAQNKIKKILPCGHSTRGIKIPIKTCVRITGKYRSYRNTGPEDLSRRRFFGLLYFLEVRKI